MSERYAIGSHVWPGLSKVIEETGEFGQVAGKIIGTGGEAEQHWDGSHLPTRLLEELADVAAAVEFILEANADKLPVGEFTRRKLTKLMTFRRWHAEQGGGPIGRLFDRVRS